MSGAHTEQEPAVRWRDWATRKWRGDPADMNYRTVTAVTLGAVVAAALAGCAGTGTATVASSPPPMPTPIRGNHGATVPPVPTASPTASPTTSPSPSSVAAPLPKLPAPWEKLPAVATPVLKWNSGDANRPGTAAIWVAPASKRAQACQTLVTTYATWSAANPAEPDSSHNNTDGAFSTAQKAPAKLAGICANPADPQTFGTGTTLDSRQLGALDDVRVTTTRNIIAALTWTQGRIASAADFSAGKPQLSYYVSASHQGDLTVALYSGTMPPK